MDSSNLVRNKTTVRKIIDTWQDHPNVTPIKSSVTQNRKFNLPHVTDQGINKIINSFKATGSEGIPVKLIKLSANVIDSHLANIINNDIDLNCYSENAKIANARLISKKIWENYSKKLPTC